MKPSKLIIFILGVFFIVIANFLLVFGFFNPALELIIPNINSMEIPTSFADLGNATAITSGLLSALAIILALLTIIDQKKSTKESLDIQNAQLFCQNTLASIETLRSACLVEKEMLSMRINQIVKFVLLGKSGPTLPILRDSFFQMLQTRVTHTLILNYLLSILAIILSLEL